MIIEDCYHEAIVKLDELYTISLKNIDGNTTIHIMITSER